MNALGVIPARGGSKGVPRKNLRALGGEPLVVHTLRCAAAAKGLDRVVLSTEDAEIAAVASTRGAQVIHRPLELATDDARTEGVLLHALDTLENDGYHADVVVTLEPTSPLRSPRIIDECIARLRRGGCDAVLTVVETRASLGRLVEGDRFEHLFPNQPRRRQLREPVFEESSTVYATRVEALRRTGSVLGTRPAAVIIDPTEAIDINTERDLVIAEAVLANQRRH